MRQELLQYAKAPKYSCLLMGQAGLDDMETDAVNLASVILNCNEGQLQRHPDFLLVDSGSSKSIGVEVVSEVISKSALVPALADKIVVLIRQFDKLTEQAQNMLLKLIEESQTVLIIGTCYKDNVLPTIKSRCTVVTYKPYTKDEFVKYCKEQNIPDANLLYFLTNGCPGLINSEPAVLDCFKAISNSVSNGKDIELLTHLHLLEEKDKDNFYTKYPSHVTSLLKLLSSLYQQRWIKEPRSVNYKKVCQMISEDLIGCSRVQYSKDNFFYLMANIITTTQERG